MEMSLFAALHEALHGTKSNEQNTTDIQTVLCFLILRLVFFKFASLTFITLNTARKYNYVYIVFHFTLRSNIQKTIGFQIIQVSLSASFTTQPVKVSHTHQNVSTNRCSFGVPEGLKTIPQLGYNHFTATLQTHTDFHSCNAGYDDHTNHPNTATN